MEELLLEYDIVTLVACNDKKQLIKDLFSMGIQVKAYDYDPHFKDFEHYEVKDFVFDEVELKGCVVNFNCEKTYPLGLIYKGDMILIGDNDKHNGDCNPIENCEQLITQNEIKHVYSTDINGKHFIVHGTNIS